MSEKEFVYRMRVKIFSEAERGRMKISKLCRKYGVSRTWFYKWKKRKEFFGDNGLLPVKRRKPRMPNKVSGKVQEQILSFVKEYPTYGPERIEQELKSAYYCIGHTGIYNVLKAIGLNTAKSRLEWVRKLSGEVVTADEITRDKEKAKTNHIEANYPGELISQDTFYIGCLKGIGRIYHQVGCDCFSSFGAAKVYSNKTTDTSTDFVSAHLTVKFAPVKIERILTDCGSEYTTWHKEAIPEHKFEKTCQKLGIKHTTTKVKHPWTNGYVERINKTLLDEFYSVAFRKKRYGSIDQLQKDLDEFMDYYNWRRPHQGYKLKKNGYRTPAQAHFSKNLIEIKESDKLKTAGEIMSGKEAEKNLTFALYPVKIKSENDEVLAQEFVNTS